MGHSIWRDMDDAPSFVIGLAVMGLVGGVVLFVPGLVAFRGAGPEQFPRGTQGYTKAKQYWQKPQFRQN